MIESIPLPSSANDLCWSPDGRHVAVVCERSTLVIDAVDGTTRAYKGGGSVIAWGAGGILVASHAGARKIGPRVKGEVSIAYGRGDQVEVFGGDGKLLATHPIATWRAAVSGTALAVGRDDGLAIHDAHTGAVRWFHATGGVHSVALSPDGTRVLATTVTGAWEGPCEGPLVWQPEAGEPTHAGVHFTIGRAIFAEDRSGPIARVSRSGLRKASISGARVALLFQMELQLAALDTIGNERVVGPRGDIVELAIDGARDLVAASDDEGQVCVWRASDRALLATFAVDGKPPIAFAADGTLLVASGGIQRWDAAAGKRLVAVPLPGVHHIEGLRVRGDHVLVRGHDRVALLDAHLQTRAILGPWDDTRVEAADVGRDGRVYIARDREPLLVFAPDGRLECELPAARNVAVSDRAIAVVNDDGGEMIVDGVHEPMERFYRAVGLGDAILWVDGSELGVRAPGEPRLHMTYADSIGAIAAEGDRLYTAGREKWIAERTLVDGSLRHVLGSGAGGKVVGLAFSPGDQLAVGEMEGRLHVWSLGGAPRRIGLLDGTTLQPAGTIRERGHVGSIDSIAFTAALTACGNAAMIWDGSLAAIGTTEPRTFESHISRVSRDGSRFLYVPSWPGDDTIVYDASGVELSRATGADSGAERSETYTDLSDDGRLVLLATSMERSSQLTVRSDRGVQLGTLRIAGKVIETAFDNRARVIGWVEAGPWFRWDVAAQRVERWCDAPTVAAQHVSRGGGRLALWGGSGPIVIVDEADAARVAVLPQLGTTTTAVALSDDGRRIAIGDWSGAVRVFALDPPALIATISGTTDGGWFATSAAGFTHQPGDAVTRDWSAS
jgi:WD40 repeat protein